MSENNQHGWHRNICRYSGLWHGFDRREGSRNLSTRRRGGRLCLVAIGQIAAAVFAGTLVSDFWGAYNAVCCGQRQTCLVHLLRDLEKVEHYRAANKDWPAFAKKLRRLLGDAIRLWKRNGVPEAEYASRRSRLSLRLQGLIEADWQNPDKDIISSTATDAKVFWTAAGGERA